MRKILSSAILSMLVLFFAVRMVSAEPLEVQFEVNTVSVLINNTPLELDNVIYGGRVYVPLEPVCRYYGASLQLGVEKNIIDISTNSAQTIKDIKKDKTLPQGWQALNVQKNSYKIKFNHIDTYLDSLLCKEVIYVPVRYLAEIFAKKVDWNNEKRTVVLSDMKTYDVGIVNGVPITSREYDLFFNPRYKQLKDGSSGGSVNADDIAQLKKSIFDLLVSRKILAEKAAENNIQLDAGDYDNINNSLYTLVQNYGGIVSFRALLLEYDTYFNEVTLNVKDNYLYEKLWKKLLADIGAGEDKIRKYYEDNKASFTRPESVRAKHILISTVDSSGKSMDSQEKKKAEEKARGILEKVKSCEDFDKLMNAYSEDPGLKQYPNGYEFTRGQMVREFEEAAFSLKAGETSGLVETQYGYHIIKVEEKIPQKQLTYEEVKSNIKAKLDEEEKQAYYKKTLEGWKAESKIENKLK